MELNHLHLNSPDVEKSVAFYREFLGFSRAKKLESGSYFLFSEAGFMLAIGKLPEKEKLPSWHHFGFRLKSKAEVEQLYSRIRDGGVEISEALTTYDDWTMFRCKEPAGYEIEIYWEPA